MRRSRCSVLFSSPFRFTGTWKVRLCMRRGSRQSLNRARVAWNVGCVLYIFWMGGQCLLQFINMMIWRDNAINVAPVWCDISESRAAFW